MKKIILSIFGCIIFSSCTTIYTSASLRYNYEKKLNKTTEKTKIYSSESEVGRDFEVIAYGSYNPWVIPIIRPERPRIEKNLLWKAAKEAQKLKADAVIIDSNFQFRIIKFR